MWIVVENCTRTESLAVLTRFQNSVDCARTRFINASGHDWKKAVEFMRFTHKARVPKTPQKTWAPPKATSIFESVAHWAVRRLKPSAKKMGAPLVVAVLLEIKDHSTHPNLRLNPRWVEFLMGLPIGWSNPSAKHLYF
jgi:hypothetical protein